jgi:hypothetical protein
MSITTNHPHPLTPSSLFLQAATLLVAFAKANKSKPVTLGKIVFFAERILKDKAALQQFRWHHTHHSHHSSTLCHILRKHFTATTRQLFVCQSSSSFSYIANHLCTHPTSSHSSFIYEC